MASFQDLTSTVSMLIDNNNMSTILYDTTCVMASTLATNPTALNCTESPCFITEIDTSLWVGGVTSSGSAGGYSGSGLLYSEPQTLTATDTTNQTFTTNVLLVNNIDSDYWLYNVANNGSLGFGNSLSGWMFGETNLWSIEVGPVANQSFNGFNFTGFNTNLYIGPGDYSTIFTGTSLNSLTLDNSAGLEVSKAWFGQNIQAGSFYSPLGYSQAQVTAAIQLNFQGLGLPNYEWVQVVNLLSKIPNIPQTDLSCTSGLGSMCHLSQPCSTPAYAPLWTYSFLIQFMNQANYVTVNFGSFAIDNAITGMCDLYIQQQSSIIFGSMFMQNFVALFNGTDISIMPSTNNVQPGTSINNFGPINTVGTPFTYVSTSQFPINIQGQSAYIYADLGVQGKIQFMLSLSSSVVQAFSTNCSATILANEIIQSCDLFPNYATNYFNMSSSIPLQSDVTSKVDGYSISGNIYNQFICLDSQINSQIFCTNTNENFTVVDQLNSNDWNLGSPSFAGLIGLGQGSPIWSLIDPTNSGNYYYAINYYQFMIDVFPQVPIGGPAVLELGTCNVTCDQYFFNATNITIYPTSSQTFAIDSFTFGTVNFTDQTEYSYSLINGDAGLYGSLANTTTFTLDLKGIGLPTTSFLKFVNLISIVSKGQVICEGDGGGYCVLPQECSNYQFLNEYSFKIKFTNETNYLVIPLVYFTKTVTDNFLYNCAIYVEMLNEILADSHQIVLGLGFFKAFQFYQAQSNTTVLIAGNGTISNATLTQSSVNAFQISSFNAQIYESSEFVTVLVQTNFTGFSDVQDFGVSSGFQIDLISDNTILWSSKCIQNIQEYYNENSQYYGQSCAGFPTFLNNQFNTTNQAIGQFYYMLSGGFQISGDMFIAEFNPNLQISQTAQMSYIEVYAANLIYKDSWFIQQQQNPSLGNLGYGLRSELWNQFIDPLTKTATLSVALKPFNSKQVESNITFGYADFTGYETANYLQISADQIIDGISQIYSLSEFSFGTVYQNAGIDQSSYFQNLQGNTAVFNLNFDGIGLPQNMFQQWFYLLQSLVNNQATCELNGLCYLQGECGNWTSPLSTLGNFSFQIQFNSNKTTYIRIPISSLLVGNGDSCTILVQNLYIADTQTDNIILGSMFFRQFYTIFQNDYSASISQASIQQSAQIYININALGSSAYIGSENLPQGANPFPICVFNISIDVNSTTMTASVQASLDTLNLTPFLISIDQGNFQTYTTNCTTVGTGNVSCSAQPNLATLYFDMNNYAYFETLNSTVDGYSTQGYNYNLQFCIGNNEAGPDICSNSSQVIYAADRIVQNNWNIESPATSGIMGLNPQSPIWTIFQNSGFYQYYSIQFSNVTDWSFVNALAPITTGNNIVFGQTFINAYQQQPQVMIIGNYSTQTGTNQILLSQFSFGIVNVNNYTQSIQSILNSNQEIYGTNTNLTIITLDFKGIGLPTQSFNKFVNLLEIASSGQATCLETQGGYCSLPKTCKNYQSLWKYSFSIAFNQVPSQSFIIPLASFVSDRVVNGVNRCVIYIENLDESLIDSQQIVLGQMLFQSIYFQMKQAPNQHDNYLTLQINQNALPNTYLLNTTFYQQASDAFAIVSDKFKIKSPGSIYLFPAVSANFGGYYSGANPYFMLDFSSQRTVVWDVSCTQILFGKNQTCVFPPTGVAVQYNSTSPPTEQYSNMSFGGYLTSGNIHLDQLTIGTNTKDLEIYSATSISQDTWLYDQANSFVLSYGIIGYGINSSLWNQYINPSTGTASYSIGLNKTNLINSNITLGGSGAVNYSSEPCVSISTGASALYNVDVFGFGVVYQTNGLETSSYFQNLTTYPIQFSIMFQGIGLPAELWNQWAALMLQLDNTTVCIARNNGGCLVQGTCANNIEQMQFSFQIIFPGSSNYMRVPLSLFAVNTGNACNYTVSYLNSGQVSTENIILGVNFFETFFGIFSNQYSSSPIGQSAQIYIQQGATQPISYARAYIGNQTLPSGINPYLLPTQFLCQVTSTFMPSVTASFGGLANTTYLINNNAALGYAWTTGCQQTFLTDLPDSDCTASPSFVTESLDLSKITGGGIPFSAVKSGGYTISGTQLNNILIIQSLNPGNINASVSLQAVEQISGNVWMYDVHSLSGAIGFGVGSQILNQISTNNVSQWSIEIGNIADQSFAGGLFSASNASILYIGEGNYGKLYPLSSANYSTIIQQNSLYQIDAAWFGSATYYQQLGNSYINIQKNNVTISFNYQGIGLTHYIWNQVVSMLYKVNKNITDDLNCSSGPGGKCKLAQTCNSTDYSVLWSLFFTVQFDQQYIKVNLGSFAVTNGSSCDLYIQYLEESPYIVLGSMWLQNFVAYFQQDEIQQSITLLVSNYSLPGASINNVVPKNSGQNPFSYQPAQLNLTVGIDQNSMTATIQANIGFQGSVPFLVSLTGGELQSFSTNCVTNQGQSCTDSPNFAINYFNTSKSIPIGNLLITYDGYTTVGPTIQQPVCVFGNQYCSVFENIPFSVANTINSNTWNSYSPSYAGIMGFGFGSPIWGTNITSINLPGQYIWVQFIWNGNWNYYQPDIPIISGNQIIMGQDFYSPYKTDSFYESQNFITFSTVGKYQLSEYFNLSQFSIGYMANNYLYVQNIQENITMAILTLDFRGIGLPKPLYNRFVNWINLISVGQASCAKTTGGYCILLGTCDNLFAEVFETASFTIGFGGNSIAVVPLAQFAQNIIQNQTEFCAVYVEMLENSDVVVIGQMFFQSVAYQSFQSSTQQKPNVTLYQNVNWKYDQVGFAAYVGDIQNLNVYNYTTDIETKQFLFTPSPEIQTELPFATPAGEFAGYNGQSYFLIDFTSDFIVVWDIDCVQIVTGVGPCANQPTNLNTTFQSTTAPIRTFENLWFGGYQCNGQVYLEKICLFGISQCKVQEIYSATLVSQNQWLYGQTGTFGILGFGLNSDLWNQFISLQGQATYFVYVDYLPKQSRELSQYNSQVSQCVVNFGPLIAQTQANLVGTNLTIQANIGNQSTYQVNELGFGLVYNSNGVAQSSYFSNITNNSQVQMTLNFVGMGLPSQLYEQYSLLFMNLTQQIVCDPVDNGFCKIKGNCTDFTQFDSYSFQVLFENSTTYIRIPLAGFKVQNELFCEIQVINLVQSTNVILGSKFYAQFQVITNNTYDSNSIVAQNTQLFNNIVIQWEATYIGDELLPMGQNPFIPIIPPTPNDKKNNTWVIVLCVVIVILAIALSVVVYKWRKSMQEQAEKKDIIYNSIKEVTKINNTEDLGDLEI